MASICLLSLGFLAVIAGLAYFYNSLRSITGSVVIIAIGLVALFVIATSTDLLLSRAFNLETGLPTTGQTDYYLYQAAIYLALSIPLLGAYWFLLKDSMAKEISNVFWWLGLLLMLAGSFDLLIEIFFVRVPLLEVKLCVAMVLLIGLIAAAVMFRSRIFGKNEGAAVSAKPAAPLQKGEAKG